MRRDSPSGERYPPDDPREWINRARSSLAVASAHPEGAYLEDLCFVAQQAAEKALKAVLVARAARVPRTHDLGALLSAIERSGVHFPASLKALVVLTSYAVATRYPGTAEPVEPADYEEALDLARSAVAWAALTVAEAC